MHVKPVWIYKFSKVYSKYIYFRFQAERKRAEFFHLSNDEAKRNRLLYLKIMSTQVTKEKYIHTFFVDFASNLYTHLVILIQAPICSFFWCRAVLKSQMADTFLTQKYKSSQLPTAK